MGSVHRFLISTLLLDTCYSLNLLPIQMMEGYKENIKNKVWALISAQIEFHLRD